ncbi:MAG: translational GTPase TypA [bacterium]
MQISTDKIRNIAIIAHVDHGKTTLVDAFLKQTSTFRSNEQEMSQTTIMDSNDLERERGITILAKNTSVFYKDHKINIIDTPGHADFGGEVERVLNMAEGAILLVDAQEGTMPQTKFVLKNALSLGLKLIVVINKIDKRFADVDKTLGKIHDLFLDLVTEDHQLDFPVLYAVSREGKVFTEMPEFTVNEAGDKVFPEADIKPLLDEIIKFFPAPDNNTEKPFQMQVSNLDYDAHLGNLVIGKVVQGTPKLGQAVSMIESDTKTIQSRITKLFTSNGLKKEAIEEAVCGDIISLSGFKDARVGSTICDISIKERLPDIKITEPSLKIKFEPNTSPFAGREGKYVTSRQILERLQKEMLTNVAMKLDVIGESEFIVSGRGELHLGILIEKIRREGYEFQISKPEVIYKIEDGKIMEPQEILYIDVPDEFIGAITNELAGREAEMIAMEMEDNHMVRFSYKITTRELLGLRGALLTQTKGTAVINNFFDGYVAKRHDIAESRKGVLVSSESGKAFDYALEMVQERGALFIKGQDEIYEGMIIGINRYDIDMDVNPCKERHKTGVRISHIEIDVPLTTPIELTLDFALTFINSDELLEVTPSILRLRKKYLTKTQRDIALRGSKTDIAKKILGNTK